MTDPNLHEQMNRRFYELFRPEETKVKRECLKCGKVRKCTRGNRICSVCTDVNKRAPARAELHSSFDIDNHSGASDGDYTERYV